MSRRAAPAGLGRARRLRKRRDFLAAQELGARATLPHHVFLFVPSEAPAARLGVTASKRQVGGAVERNRTKRLIRAAFRELSGLFAPGADVVVIAREGAERMSLPAVCAEWRAGRRHLERARLRAGAAGLRTRSLCPRSCCSG